MAFQQPIARPSRRLVSPTAVQTAPPTPEKPEPVCTSQDWIHFSSAPYHTASDSLQTPRTAARSRFSDLGSLKSAAESAKSGLVQEEYEEEGTEDLDSLDDGLNAFCERIISSETNHALASSVDPVLPTHDGLGLFPGDSSPVQAQLWHHEQYNPQRHKHGSRRASLQRQIEALESEERDHSAVKDERYERIQAWRLDQSRVIVDEIEKQSRRQRRRSRLSAANSALGNTGATQARGSVSEAGSAIKSSQNGDPEMESESFWARLTRCVMRDFMGIDDTTLSYIFGESLPPERSKPREVASDHNEADVTTTSGQEHLGVLRHSDSWEERLLARIARELGILVNQISDHPGAFSTFLRTKEPPQYAGLPTPARYVSETSRQKSHTHVCTSYKHRRRRSAAMTERSLFGIEEEAEDGIDVSRDPIQGLELAEQDREYWERDIDVKMVFGFLRGRLSSSSPKGSEPVSGYSDATGASPWSGGAARSAPTTSLRRAALIRHHHPLVSNITGHSQTLMSSTLPTSPVLGRRQNSLVDADEMSSCASQSTKKSKTYHSGSLTSSRNYWDIGGPSWGQV